MPLLSEAEGFRARVAQRELRAEADKANARVAETIEKDVPPVLEAQSGLPPVTEAPPQSLVADRSGSTRVIELTHRGVRWKITIELSLDPAVEDWLTLTDRPPSGNALREIVVRMSLAHPFMQRFCRTDSSEIEGLERVAIALALAENYRP